MADIFPGRWVQLSCVRSSFLIFCWAMWPSLPPALKVAPASSLCLSWSLTPPPPTSVSLPGLLCRAHSVPCKLSPCDLVTVVRVYGEELYCPLFGLAEQQVRASSGSIFNLHPLSPLKILRSQLDWLSESFGFLKDVILGSPRHPVNQALSGWLGKLYFPRLPMIGCIWEPLF